MPTYLKQRFYCGLLLLIALSGCGAKSSLDDETTEPESTPVNTADGIATQILDATNNEVWVYFNLADNAVVYPAQPASSTAWDIAFQRFKIKTNSGISGNGGVQIAALKDTAFDSVQALPTNTLYHADRALSELSDSELIALDAGQFFAVCAIGYTCIDTANATVDRTHLNTAIAAYAMLTYGSGVMHEGSAQKNILGWYDYYFDEGHVLRPAGDTWLIKTVSGIAIKLEMLGYYGLNNSSEAGNMAFRYQSLTPGFSVPAVGAAQLKANIDTDVTQGQAALLVHFSAVVSGGTAVQWHWDFGDKNGGDGNSAATADAAHTYQTAGSYIATLTVADQRGAQATKSVTIIVSTAGNQAPTANAGSDQTIQLGAGDTQTQITLNGSASSDNDGTIVSYHWAGSPKPNDEMSPTLILGIGHYVFTLTVTDDDGTSTTDTIEITIASPSNTPPVAHIAATPTSGGTPLNVQFDASASSDSDGSIVAYQWDFGDGHLGSGNTATSMAPLHSYAQPGQYTATLTVTDDGGAIATTTQTIDAALIVSASADTYVYQFLGNQNATPSDPLLVWAHESNHAAKILLDFDALDTQLSALAAGNFTATLKLYIVCNLGAGGFVQGCPGQPDTDSSGGVATVTTSIRAQLGAWQENDSALLWAGVQEGTQYATFTVNQSGYWIDVDVTALVEAWRAAGSTGAGIVLTQQNFPVVRTDAGNIAVLGIRSRESSQTNEIPYLEIRKSGP